MYENPRLLPFHLSYWRPSRVEPGVGSMSDLEQMRRNLQGFAREHKIVFNERGEVGFGRPCVGLLKDGKYIDHNPYVYVPSWTTNQDIERAEGFEDDRLYPGETAPDSYHKHDCLAVLALGDEPNYDEAVRQLHAWIEKLRKIGPLEIVEYKTGAQGMQALFSGTTAHAIRFVDAASPRELRRGE